MQLTQNNEIINNLKHKWNIGMMVKNIELKYILTKTEGRFGQSVQNWLMELEFSQPNSSFCDLLKE